MRSPKVGRGLTSVTCVDTSCGGRGKRCGGSWNAGLLSRRGSGPSGSSGSLAHFFLEDSSDFILRRTWNAVRSVSGLSTRTCGGAATRSGREGPQRSSLSERRCLTDLSAMDSVGVGTPTSQFQLFGAVQVLCDKDCEKAVGVEGKQICTLSPALPRPSLLVLEYIELAGLGRWRAGGIGICGSKWWRERDMLSRRGEVLYLQSDLTLPLYTDTRAWSFRCVVRHYIYHNQRTTWLRPRLGFICFLCFTLRMASRSEHG